MPTKGASNRYGNSRGSRNGHPTEHTGFAWAKDFDKSTLKSHAEKHGQQDGTVSYVAHAVAFANRIDRQYHVSYVRKDGSTVKYSKKTNEFVIVDKNGLVKTYYKPKSGIKEYYKDRRKHNC